MTIRSPHQNGTANRPGLVDDCFGVVDGWFRDSRLCVNIGIR